jgi:hypothetical protein
MIFQADFTVYSLSYDWSLGKDRVTNVSFLLLVVRLPHHRRLTPLAVVSDDEFDDPRQRGD